MNGIYEVTVALIKPDVVRRHEISEVLAFMERRFDIVDVGMFQWRSEHVSEWYAEHATKEWFPSFVEFMTSAPMMHVLLGGAYALSSWRKAMGATDPAKAEADTVRYKWGSRHGPVMCNAVHGSDSPQRVLFEIDRIRSMAHPGFARVIWSRGWGAEVGIVPGRSFAPWLQEAVAHDFRPPSIAKSDEASQLQLLSVAELERRYMLHVLRTVAGNKSKAARILGYDRRTLYRKLARLTQSERYTSEPFELSIP